MQDTFLGKDEELGEVVRFKGIDGFNEVVAGQRTLVSEIFKVFHQGILFCAGIVILKIIGHEQHRSKKKDRNEEDDDQGELA